MTKTLNIKTLIRDLHLYTGLFICPFVLIFAFSTILLNHTWKPWSKKTKEPTVTVPMAASLPDSLTKLEKVEWIRDQIGISGEASNLFHNGNMINTQITRPGEQYLVWADVEAGTANVTKVSEGFWDRLIYLHKTPGPHLAGFRGNWVFVQIWRALGDLTVALLLFSTASGIYLWLLIRAQRRAGLLLLGGGAATFILLITLLTA